MSKKEILEGNKLIAEFMGLKISKIKYQTELQEGYNYWKLKAWTPEGIKTYEWYGHIDSHCELLKDEGYLKFNHSWDWLMPVVYKISKTSFNVGKEIHYYYPRTFGMTNPETGNTMFRFNCFSVHESPIFIETTWLAVVEFIEWFNKQK